MSAGEQRQSSAAARPPAPSRNSVRSGRAFSADHGAARPRPCSALPCPCRRLHPAPVGAAVRGGSGSQRAEPRAGRVGRRAPPGPCGAERERGRPRREGREGKGGKGRPCPSQPGWRPPALRAESHGAGRAAKACHGRAGGQCLPRAGPRPPAVPPPCPRLPAPWRWQPPPRDFPRRPSAPARRALAALCGSERCAGPGRTSPASPGTGPELRAEGKVTAVKRNAEQPGGAEGCQGNLRALRS